MIAENNRSIVLSDGVLSESFFSVKQENLAHIFSILRNNLYSNKPLAIIREYCTNAQDAMVEAGKGNDPITITCPTLFEPTLSIRDYGNGLSEEQVYNIFASYGESTKRSSNDMVGMLGLGSKSAFSYVDSFTVTSFNGGMKKVYTAYIDDSGIGKISKIHEEESDESGLEISLAVRRNDNWQFEDNMYKFLREFSPMPNIMNGKSLIEKIECHDKKTLISGTNWELRKPYDYRTHYVKMGNVVYPFTESNLDFNPDIKSYVSKLNSSIFLYANIGDINFTISRESLEYTERTKNYLINAITQVSEELIGLIADEINQSKNYWDAKIAYRKFQNYIPSDNVFKVNNMTIDSKYFNVIDHRISTRRKYNKNKWEVISSITPEPNQTFFLYKGNVPRKSILVRSLSYINDNGLDAEKCFVIGFDNETDANNFIAMKYLDGQNVIDVATIPYEFFKKNRTRGEAIKSDVYQLLPSLSYASSSKDYWVACESSVLDEEEGIYMPIKYFKPFEVKGLGENAFYQLSQLKIVLESYGYKWPVIYGIKPSEIKELNSGWIDLPTHIQNYLDELPSYVYNEISRIELRSTLDSFWFQMCSYLNQTNEKVNTEIDSFVDSVMRFESVQLQSNRRRASAIREFGYDFPTDLVSEIKQQSIDLQNKYPLLSYFRSGSIVESLMPEIIKYMKACQ